MSGVDEVVGVPIFIGHGRVLRRKPPISVH